MHDQPPGEHGQGSFPDWQQGSGPPDGYPPQPPYGPPPGQGQGGRPYPEQGPQPPYGQPPAGPGPAYPGGPTPPYGQPPYGDQTGAPWGAPPPQGGQGMGGFGPPENPTANWGMPPGPPPNKGSKLIIVAAVVAVIVVLGGAGAIVWAMSGSKHSGKPANVAASSPVMTTTTPAPAPLPTTTPTVPASPSLPALDPALTASVGDCLANAGTMTHAKLVASSCHPGTYKLLKRIYATADDTKCKAVSGSDITFTRKNSYSKVLDLVLCMKKL